MALSQPRICSSGVIAVVTMSRSGDATSRSRRALVWGLSGYWKAIRSSYPGRSCFRLSPVVLANALPGVDDLLHHQVTSEHAEGFLPVVPSRLRCRGFCLEQLLDQLLQSREPFFNRGLRHVGCPQ